MKKKIIFGFVLLLIWPIWSFLGLLFAPSEPSTLSTIIFLIFLFIPLPISLSFFVSAFRLHLTSTPAGNEVELRNKNSAKKFYFFAGVALIVVSGINFMTTVSFINSAILALAGGVLVAVSFRK